MFGFQQNSGGSNSNNGSAFQSAFSQPANSGGNKNPFNMNSSNGSRKPSPSGNSNGGGFRGGRGGNRGGPRGGFRGGRGGRGGNRNNNDRSSQPTANGNGNFSKVNYFQNATKNNTAEVSQPTPPGFKPRNRKKRPIPPYLLPSQSSIQTVPSTSDPWDIENQNKMLQVEQQMGHSDMQSLYEKVRTKAFVQKLH
ncbi:hypothetical protein TRICI_001078 [Trichomonascus ciferrii]|uniref:Uncharacterized protein n=1 Tax=Trichomonascus ciferrii TaxID=44093 RepID=A0A642V9G5_9ASCO|nr:hypothetical protein TRICI_001078 [Trichomonascus ciferrii]